MVAGVPSVGDGGSCPLRAGEGSLLGKGSRSLPCAPALAHAALPAPQGPRGQDPAASGRAARPRAAGASPAAARGPGCSRRPRRAHAAARGRLARASYIISSIFQLESALLRTGSGAGGGMRTAPGGPGGPGGPPCLSALLISEGERPRPLSPPAEGGVLRSQPLCSPAQLPLCSPAQLPQAQQTQALETHI